MSFITKKPKYLYGIYYIMKLIVTENQLKKIIVNEQPGILKSIFGIGKTTSKEMGAVLKDTRAVSSELKQILAEIPEMVKMPKVAFEPLKIRMLSIEGDVSRLSKVGSTIKGTHLSLFTSVENVVKELKIPAGSQFNLKKLINELLRAKSELERLLKITKNSVEINQMNVCLRDVNWSIGNIEDILKKARKK